MIMSLTLEINGDNIKTWIIQEPPVKCSQIHLAPYGLLGGRLGLYWVSFLLGPLFAFVAIFTGIVIATRGHWPELFRHRSSWPITCVIIIALSLFSTWLFNQSRTDPDMLMPANEAYTKHTIGPGLPEKIHDFRERRNGYICW